MEETQVLNTEQVPTGGNDPKVAAERVKQLHDALVADEVMKDYVPNDFRRFVEVYKDPKNMNSLYDALSADDVFKDYIPDSKERMYDLYVLGKQKSEPAKEPSQSSVLQSPSNGGVEFGLNQTISAPQAPIVEEQPQPASPEFGLAQTVGQEQIPQQQINQAEEPISGIEEIRFAPEKEIEYKSPESQLDEAIKKTSAEMQKSALRSKGSIGGAVYNSLVEGYTGTVEAISRTAMELMLYTMPFFAEEGATSEDINNSLEAMGIKKTLDKQLKSEGTTKEYIEKQKEEGGILTQGALGLAESIYPMMYPKQAGFFFLGFSGASKEISETMPELSKDKQLLYAFTQGTVAVALEKFGFTNLIKNKSVTKAITGKVLEKLKNVTGVLTPSKVQQTVLDVANGFASEFETGATQFVVEEGIKQATDYLGGEKDSFKFEGWESFLTNTLKAGAVEGVGGAIMKTASLAPSIMLNPKNKSEAQEANAKNETLMQDLQNPNIPDDVKEVIQKQADENSKTVLEKAFEDKEQVDSLPTEAKTEVEQLNKTINENTAVLQNENVSAETKELVAKANEDLAAQIEKIFKDNPPTQKTTEAKQVIAEITDAEYNEFIDKGIVADERLNDIAAKVKNQEPLSEKEKEIFADKTSQVNEIIAKETKTTKNDIQEPSTTQEIPRTREGGENIAEGGQGVRPGEQGKETAKQGEEEVTPQAGSVGVGGDAGTSLLGVKYSDIIVDDKYLEDILSDNKLSEEEKKQVRDVFARAVDYFKFDKEGEQKFQEKFANPEDITDVADIITGLSAAQQSAFNFYNTKNYENVKDAVNYIANNPNEYSPKVIKAVKEIKEKLDNPSSSMSRLYAIDVMKELGISEQSLKETPKAGSVVGGENPALKEIGVEIKKDGTSEGFYQVYKDGKFVGLLGATSFEQARNKGQYFDEALMSDILTKMGIEHSKAERNIQGENEFLTIRIKDSKAVEQSLQETQAELLTTKTTQDEKAEKRPMLEGLQATGDEGKGGQAGAELRTEAKGKKEIEELAEPIVIFKGNTGKLNPDGSRRTAHPNIQGVFGSTDLKSAERYGNDISKFDIPKGTTVETVEIKNKKIPLSEARKQETELVNASDAQIVRLITYDAKGREVQYIIKDKSILQQNKPIKNAEENLTPNIPTNESKNENGKQKDGEKRNENVSESVQGKGKDGGQEVNVQNEGELLTTKQQIENFGVAPEMVEPVNGVISQVFESLKKAGLTAAKNVGEWIGIGKGKEKPYSLKINGNDVQVKNVQPEVVNGFYSPLEKIINEAKQDKMPAKQWAEKYANSEEAKWTGLKDWLSQQQGSVSKADIQQYLKDNRISVVEVVKGGGRPEQSIINDIEKEGYTLEGSLGEEGYVIMDKEGEMAEYDELPDNVRKLYDELSTVTISDASGTKFSQYQLEGEKSNYKEVLVTLPNRTPLTFEEFKARAQKETSMDDYEVKAAYKNYIAKGDFSKLAPNQFKSSHFDEPNILVHLRMNTRTDANGNKVLFLEEVQSDWGQEGKKKGFINKEREDVVYFIAREIYNIRKSSDSSDIKKEKLTKAKEKAEKNKVSESDIQKAFEKYGDFTNNPVSLGGVQESPFVTDTNAWTKLGLKVALKEAVAQGADKIAWTTGEQQNERYDLRKQVDEIYYSKTKDGAYRVWAKKDGNIIFKENSMQEKELEQNFGKDVAEKIINDKGQSQEGLAGKKLSGNDLAVGGKGMKGFYGSPTEGTLGIVGNVAKSLFKQEPKTVKIDKGSYYQDSEGNIVGRARVQNSIDITPELKASVEGGQPLFKKGESKKDFGGFETRDGKPIGFTYDTDKVARERFDFSKLKKIGSGSDRDVYDLGNGKVVKVAKTARGLTQNIYEGDYYLKGIIPEVFERGLNYVVAESTPRIKTSDVVQTFDVDGNSIGTATAGEMLKDLQKFSQKNMDNLDSKLQDVLAKYGLQDVMSYNVLWGDFIAQRNWGYKDGVAYHSDGGTFGGVDMITSFKGKANLSDPEFREIYQESKKLKKQFGDTDKATMYKEQGGDVQAQYRIESGKNTIEAIKEFDGSPEAVVALTHEIMHPTVVAIIDGAAEGNEVGTRHTQTIVDEFNKANPKSKVTVDELIAGNNAFREGTTSEQYRDVQEFIAESWEKYHTEGGKGFSEAFQKVLEQITEAFRAVYKTLTGKQLTPELRQMFDEILGKEAAKVETDAFADLANQFGEAAKEAVKPETPTAQTFADISQNGKAGRDARESARKKFGKDAVAKMEEISRNFDKLIEQLESENKVRKECP